MNHFAEVTDAPIFTIVALLLLVILAFEIAMFVDVIQNEHISSNQKILWVVGMILVHPFVAIVYYFTARKSGSK